VRPFPRVPYLLSGLWLKMGLSRSDWHQICINREETGKLALGCSCLVALVV